MEDYVPSARALEREAAHKAKQSAKDAKKKGVKSEAIKSDLGVEAPAPASFGQSIEASAEALDHVANNSNDPRTIDVFRHTTKARASLDAHDTARIAGDHEVAAGHLANAAASMGHAIRAWHKISPFSAGPEEAVNRIKNVAQNYRVQVAGGSRAQVKQAKTQGAELASIADSGLKAQQKNAKSWSAENNRQKKTLAPNVQRATPEQQESSRQENLTMGRQFGHKGEGDVSTRRMGSPVAYESQQGPVGEGAKYLGHFSTFGSSGTPVVPKENREIFKAHLDDAIEAVRKGKPIPRETKESLGSNAVGQLYKARARQMGVKTAKRDSFNEGMAK